MEKSIGVPPINAHYAPIYEVCAPWALTKTATVCEKIHIFLIIVLAGPVRRSAYPPFLGAARKDSIKVLRAGRLRGGILRRWGGVCVWWWSDLLFLSCLLSSASVCVTCPTCLLCPETSTEPVIHRRYGGRALSLRGKCENLIPHTVQHCVFLCISVLIVGKSYMHRVCHMPLSPAAAAKIAGVSRSLISREIKSGSLRATRKNNGHQAIERPDLDDWMSRRTERADTPEPPPAMTRHEPAQEASAISQELATMRETVARLEGRAEATEARLSDLTAERDRLAGLLEKALQAQPIAPVSLWSRIFGS